MAASPRLAARPSLSLSRTAIVALTVSVLMFASLAVIHPIAELAIIAFAPGAVAGLFAGGERQQFLRNARVAVLASGLAGASWLIVSAGTEENVIGMLIAAAMSFFIMLGLGAAGAFAIDAVQRRR